LQKRNESEIATGKANAAADSRLKIDRKGEEK
jgi:hypothetical protein